VASSWQGLEGNGINKEKSVSLRQRYGRREWLMVERGPTMVHTGTYWSSYWFRTANCEIFKQVDVKLVASK